jgi:hypothetical protein
MCDARKLAEAEGVSVNQFLSTVIAQRIGELKALSYLRNRAARADIPRARAILAKVLARKPQKGDELPEPPARRKR